MLEVRVETRERAEGDDVGKVFAVEYVTLDGVFEEPAWSGPYFNEELQQFQWNNLVEADGLLLGRVTYQGFAQAWPAMEAETGEFGVRMNSIPKWVASTTLTSTEWNASVLTGDDVPAAVSALKQQPDLALMVAGSATLLATLRAHGLIDELRLMIYPVTVGTGRRLFADGGPDGAWTLTEATTTTSGVIVARYTPA
jgi:dihydrofolate reductase